jgi:hypothetical protein
MSTLETEHVGERGAGCRELITAAVGELEGRARIGAGARHVPLIVHSDLLGKGQRYRPTAQCSGAGIGDTHVNLEVGS